MTAPYENHMTIDYQGGVVVANLQFPIATSTYGRLADWVTADGTWSSVAEMLESKCQDAVARLLLEDIR
jgi:hypothetical protein